MPTASVNPLDQWPKVTKNTRGKQTVLRVKGRCVSAPAWMVLRILATLLIFLGNVSLLATALFPWLRALRQNLPPHNPLNLYIDAVEWFRSGLRELLTETLPVLGKAIFYTGSNYDWHLLIVLAVTYRLRHLLSYGLAVALGGVLSPLLAQRFKVSFTRDAVIIHRWLRSVKLERRHAVVGGEVKFLNSGPESQTGVMGLMIRLGKIKPGGEIDFIQVMAVAQRRKIAVVSPRKRLDADRVLQSLELALQHSRNI